MRSQCRVKIDFFSFQGHPIDLCNAGFGLVALLTQRCLRKYIANKQASFLEPLELLELLLLSRSSFLNYELN